MILLEVVETGTKLSRVLDSLVEQGAALGWTLIKALLVFIVGRFLISMINKLVQRVLLEHWVYKRLRLPLYWLLPVWQLVWL